MKQVTVQEVIDALRELAKWHDIGHAEQKRFALAERIRTHGIEPPSLDALIADAVAKEREACAKLCDGQAMRNINAYESVNTYHEQLEASAICATHIRARSAK